MAPISPFSTENAECGQIQVEGATPGHAPLPQVEFISALRKLSFCCSFPHCHVVDVCQHSCICLKRRALQSWQLVCSSLTPSTEQLSVRLKYSAQKRGVEMYINRHKHKCLEMTAGAR
jgi:hypothetical protein